MHIRFETTDFGDEAASLRAVGDGRAPDEADHLWGAVLLDAPGQPSVKVEDDLTMLGLALCVDVPASLERDGRATLRSVGFPITYSFEMRPNGVRVTGSLGADACFPRADLLAGLRDCGRRLATFMDALSTSHPQFAFSARVLLEKL